MAEVKILLVEEQDTIRAFLQKLLRREGHVVAGFARADEALAHLRSGFVPNVVIANSQSDEGRALATELAKSPVWSRVPLLASSGDAARIVESVKQLLSAQTYLPAEWDSVDFVVANYGTMAARLPALLARLSELSAEAGVLDEVQGSLDEAARGGRHMRSFVRYLRDYGHSEGEARVATDVTQALEQALEIAEHQINSRAHLVRELLPLPVVMASERQLSHVFLSLIINSVQAIEAGRADANRLRVAARTDENGWAVVEIEDSGSGIAAEVLPKIFDPYFSTKGGEGLGLGLYVSRTSLTQWGGSVACVRSEPGSGSTFRVELPPAAPRSAR
jgi:signal transduction histidine kinase